MMGMGLIGANIFLSLRSPYLFSETESYELEKMVSGQRVLLLRETVLDIFAAAPILKEARASYVLDRRDGRKIRAFFASNEAETGLLVFYKAGSFVKYLSKRSLEEDGFGLVWCGMYDADSRIYDVYVKTDAVALADKEAICKRYL